MGDTDRSTKTEILDAARAALVEHGYVALSMGKIADEFGRSQSLLHYHFDSKEKLLAALLRREREAFGEQASRLPDDPERRLDELVELFVRDYSGWAEREPMAARYAELLATARDSEPIQRELRAYTDEIRLLFVEAVRDGVEAGVFADVNPEQVGHLVYAASTTASEHWLLDEVEKEDEIADALEAFVISEVKG